MTGPPGGIVGAGGDPVPWIGFIFVFVFVWKFFGLVLSGRCLVRLVLLAYSSGRP